MRTASKGWRIAKEPVPVDGGGRSPRADRGVPIEPGFDHVQLADGSTGQQFFRLLVDQRTDVLAADLQCPACPLLRLDHRRAFLDRMDHWLFAINVLSDVQGIDGNPLMPVIRRRYYYGIDIFAGEHFALVARR